MPHQTPDIASMVASLRCDNPAETLRPEWLEDSYQQPGRFWRTLMRAGEAFFDTPGRSILFKAYDFYHDIVVRNRNTPTPAFCWYDPALGWRRLTYPALARAATRQAPAWQRLGAAPGAKLCIVLPLSPEFVVSLAAAFKIGLTLSILPPLGKDFLMRRLQHLAPDHIQTDRLFRPLPAEWDGIVLDPETDEPSAAALPETSHAYPSGTVVGRFFDPSSPAVHMPVALTADALYLHPLRDGVISLGLQPGRSLAAPGFHFLETQPALLVSALLNGATFFHIDPAHLKDRPELLNEVSIDCMGLHRSTKELFRRRPPALKKKWSLLFRGAVDTLDPDTWQPLVEALDAGSALCMNLQWDAAGGGCCLFSKRTKGRFHRHVLPTAGIPWSLTDAAGGGAEIDTPVGVLTVDPPEPLTGETRRTPHLIMADRHEWLYLGSDVVGRNGRFYPVDEVLTTVGRIPSCALCSISALPGLQHPGSHRFTLLIFSGPQPHVAADVLMERIHTTLRQDLGREFLPDNVRVIPLFPRLNDDHSIDHDWCHTQFATGSLGRKANDALFQCITGLRRLLAAV